MTCSEKIKVSVITLAYNHEKYIHQCLEGVISQNTNFKFELLIHDDASTDKTADIIREYEAKYPDIIKPIYQIENQYSKGGDIGRRFIYPKAKGKYIAICEGDDYWIDPLKLQKQVDFLENNPDYGLVYTNHLNYFQKNDSFEEHHCDEVHDIAYLLKGNKIPTLTTCFKRELLQDYLDNFYPKMPKFPFGDYSLWLYLFSKAKFYLLPEVTSVYRVLENSASHFTDYKKEFSFEQKVYECRLFFIENLYPKETYLIEKVKYNYFYKMLKICILYNNESLFIDKKLQDYYLEMKNKNNKFGIKYRLLKCNFSFFSRLFRSDIYVKNIKIKVKSFFNLK
ncbi:Chondroitin polymerase [Phocoenobacter uteri]|uniref:Chondroitin polymerase n=1 Tax=Phocoenobacter uteri TaxID=146806 RepID=A0A379CA55_9PAST|nr:glycosyltransferase [Phocoenobacter uteri]MDG6881122.1 hypothetical protein [Phocoenobacter uteri]SUB59144.1 Chondroitin polymerase [Phocoenobacter uteri]